MATGSYDFGYIPRDDYNYNAPSNEVVVPTSPQYAPPPITEEEMLYRGLVNGVPTFTNIPEVAQAQGLRRWVPSTPEREVTGLGTVIGKASDEELLNAMNKMRYGEKGEYAPLPYTAENLEKAQRYKEQVASAKAFEAGAPARQSEAMRSKILRWASANKIPAAEVAATMKNYGVGEAATAPKYETLSPGQRMVDASGRVIYEAPGKVEAEREPTSEFGMFAKDYLQRSPGTSMAQIVKDFHGARIPETRPLPVTALTNLRNPETLEPLPYGTTAEEAQAMGAIRVSQKNVDALKDLDNTDVLINQIDSITKRLMTATTPGEAIAGGGVKKLGAFTRTSPISSAYNDQKAAFLGVISRTMGGERGVLTDRDISRIENSLPGFTDTKQLRDYKINTIKNLMGIAKQAARAKLVGGEVDTSGMRAQIDQQLDELEGIAPKAIQPVASATGGGTGGVRKYNPVTGTFGGGMEARADGGPVKKGTPYIVGERGPEVFVPKESGGIVPNYMASGAITPPAKVILKSIPKIHPDFGKYTERYYVGVFPDGQEIPGTQQWIVGDSSPEDMKSSRRQAEYNVEYTLSKNKPMPKYSIEGGPPFQTYQPTGGAPSPEPWEDERLKYMQPYRGE